MRPVLQLQLELVVYAELLQAQDEVLPQQLVPSEQPPQLLDLRGRGLALEGALEDVDHLLGPWAQLALALVEEDRAQLLLVLARLSEGVVRRRG